jgi:hypothetical protein
VTDPTLPETKSWHRPIADPTGDRDGFIRNIATLRGHIATLAAQVVALGGVPAEAPTVEQVPLRVRDAAIEQRLKLMDRELKLLEQDLAEERRQRLRATEQLSEAKVTIDRLRRESGCEPTAHPAAAGEDHAPAAAKPVTPTVQTRWPALERREVEPAAEPAAVAAPAPARPAPKQAALAKPPHAGPKEPQVIRALRELGEADAAAIAQHLGTTYGSARQGLFANAARLLKRREGMRVLYRLPA